MHRFLVMKTSKFSHKPEPYTVDLTMTLKAHLDHSQ